MKFDKKAQQIIESLLLVAAVVVGALAIAGPNGPMHKAVEKSLNSAIDTIYESYTWRTGQATACDCGTNTQTRNVFCQKDDGSTVADSLCANNGPKPPSTLTCNAGACNAPPVGFCSPGINGAPGRRCSVGTIGDGASANGTCDQVGTCTASCNSGNLTFNNNCIAYVNCSSATDGAAGAECTVGAMSHGASKNGTCDQQGTCSASCFNGTLAFSNNCAPVLGCAAGTNGTGGTQCSVPAMAGGANALGTCAQIGTCSASCNNGVLAFTNNCALFANCNSGVNGAVGSQCTVSAMNHGVTGNGTCDQLGACTGSCYNGTIAYQNQCTPFVSCAATTDGPIGARCTVGLINYQSSAAGTCDQLGTCLAECNTDTGIPTFTNNCRPFANCDPGTNGTTGTLCSVGATNHAATSTGTCDQLGTCTAICSNGTFTYTNNCRLFSSCIARTNGSAGSRCSVGAMASGVSLTGACDQLGTCSASCDNGVDTFTNNCTPFANCTGGTNGNTGHQCTMGAVNSGSSASGSCDQSGTCSANCFNGTLTYTNNCALSCPSGTNGPGGRRCTVPSIQSGSSATGSCDENGTCSASCTNGVKNFTNNCSPYANCPSGSNGPVGSRCTVPAINSGSSATGSCDQLGTCQASCFDGSKNFSGTCHPYANCTASSNGSGHAVCSVSAANHGVNRTGGCNELGSCSARCNNGNWNCTNTCQKRPVCSGARGDHDVCSGAILSQTTSLSSESACLTFCQSVAGTTCCRWRGASHECVATNGAVVSSSCNSCGSYSCS